MNIVNYQQILDKELDNITKESVTPRLLLHACCAPCSSYVLEYLTQYFAITIDYYNPNIAPEKEFIYRVEELRRFLDEYFTAHPTKNVPVLQVGSYEPEVFDAMAKGLEEEPEAGKRCYKCYELRLRQAAACAAEGGYDYFTTTLSISPHKRADWLNEIGGRLAEEYGVDYLYSDFKKRNGYKRSIELSAEYKLYRQDYCGCIYSKEARNRERAQ